MRGTGRVAAVRRVGSVVVHARQVGVLLGQFAFRLPPRRQRLLHRRVTDGDRVELRVVHPRAVREAAVEECAVPVRV